MKLIMATTTQDFHFLPQGTALIIERVYTNFQGDRIAKARRADGGKVPVHYNPQGDYVGEIAECFISYDPEKGNPDA